MTDSSRVGREEKYREAFRPVYKKRKETHDKHVREQKKDSPPYTGPDDWTPEERKWLREEKEKLDKLAAELKLTSEERTEIQNGVVQEVEPAENQHNIREQGASKTRAQKKAQ